MTALDFWRTSGYHLAIKGEGGQLQLSDDLLRAYLMRPELVPIEESCPAERQLHAALMDNPRQPLTPVMMVRIKDKDAAENYQVYQRFRDHLLAHSSVDAAYFALFTKQIQGIPPLFVDQLAHMILRSILDGTIDPFRLRAAECLFRSQKVTLQDGNILLADEEVIEMHAQSGGLGSLGKLLVEASAPLKQIDLDVLTEGNAQDYWQRSDRFDMVLDIGFTRPGLDGLARVMEQWIERFHGIKVRIQPKQRITDGRWAWHIGLDVHASRILDMLYRGDGHGQEPQLLSLFEMAVEDTSCVIESIRGRPIYLALAMDNNNAIRMKPQNLLVNMPLAERG